MDTLLVISDRKVGYTHGGDRGMTISLQGFLYCSQQHVSEEAICLLVMIDTFAPLFKRSETWAVPSWFVQRLSEG